jgi:hypothetical protein
VRRLAEVNPRTEERYIDAVRIHSSGVCKWSRRVLSQENKLKILWELSVRKPGVSEPNLDANTWTVCLGQFNRSLGLFNGFRRIGIVAVGWNTSISSVGVFRSKSIIFFEVHQ